MNEGTTHYLRKLTLRLHLFKVLEALCLSLSVSLIILAVVWFLDISFIVKCCVVLFSFTLTFVFSATRIKAFKVTPGDVVSFINKHYAALQESADLLLKNYNELNTLQQIQYERTSKSFQEIYSTIKFPNHIVRYSLFVLLSTGIFALTVLFASNEEKNAATSSNRKQITAAEKILPTRVKALNISITPPSYTHLDVKQTEKPELAIAEGSVVKWSIQFSSKVDACLLVFPNGDTVNLNSDQRSFNASQRFTTPTFYQIAWRENGNLFSSDFYKIDVIPDHAPQVSVNNLAQFTELSINDKLTIPLNSRLQDDYNVEDAYIIATVSKGSGESVKFREERLKFSSPAKILGRDILASSTIDLIKLGLEPGDELYFYVEAIDGKSPSPNKSRTETFFIALQDTTSEYTSVEAGLGVDLMPEYFRSQRQIIIDTEKLIKNKKRISIDEFKRTSNELGYDQKVLRLKYGEFLGEEFESGIGPGSEAGHEEDHHDGEDKKEDPTKAYGHVHDTENEHNLVPDKKHDDHAHHEEEKQDNPIAAYTHVHDDPEEATFFTQSIRAKLKAALTVMWDAELYLRLFEPEKSLPYQYKALKLLKEISNDSRIYVHKTGFDPPPIKEDKRLSGDLSEIRTSKADHVITKQETYPGVRRSLMIIEEVLASNRKYITAQNKIHFAEAGRELSALALQKPGQFLRALSLIKSLEQNEIRADVFVPSLKELEAYLWKAIPEQNINPGKHAATLHPLDKSFLGHLESDKK